MKPCRPITSQTLFSSFYFKLMDKNIIRKISALARPLMLLVFTAACVTAYAQTPVRVTLDMNDVSVEQVMRSIERQTGYVFLNRDVDVRQRVSIHADGEAFRDVLDLLFGGIGVDYRIEARHIVISRRKAPQSPEGVRTISGRVSDAHGDPVIGAVVLLKGTTVGVSTGMDGRYTLEVPLSDSDRQLSVSCLGYDTIDFSIGGRSRIDFTLTESSMRIDATVVTALGIRRSEKALSYNVTQVRADDIVAVKDANFVNSLSGKVAGLNINASSSGVGGAAKVVMRGAKSIERSSNALYVIDGIPMYDLSSTGGGEEFSSRGSSEAIADINPEDIESLSVLSGAAAAALYGSNAANGAIVITTRRGSADRTSLSVSSNTEMLTPFVMPVFQTRYGTSNGDASWGPLHNRFTYRGYRPEKDYFRTGVVGTESLTFSTGNERSQTYASASAVNSRGIIPNNGYTRYNVTVRNTSSFFKDRMKLDLGASYILQKDRNMTNQGVYSNPLVPAYLFPRGNDWEDYRMFERLDPSRNIYTQYWPVPDNSLRMQNPFWINYRNLRETAKDRYMLNASLSYRILDWLSVSARVRIDNATSDYTEKIYASSHSVITEGSKNGLYGITMTKDRQQYADVLVDIDRNFGRDWSLHANAGGSFSDTRFDQLMFKGPIADEALANFFTVWQLDKTTAKREQAGWGERTQSVFGSAEVGYRNFCFVTLTGRSDWPSQLAGPRSAQSSFFYPSAGLSFVLSELIPDMPKKLSYLKIRGSWASVGLPFARFLANPTFEWVPSANAWSTESVYPLYHLKPERTDSWEIGLAMRFLQHFRLDLTYYDTRTYNQTLDAQLSATSGYSKFYAQTGNVRNRGIELSLGYNRTWNRFTWESNYTFSANRNRILDLIDGYVHPLTGEVITKERLDVGGLSHARFLLKKGGSLGDLYSNADLVRDSNGAIYVGEDGMVSVNGNAGDIFLGSVFSKANMAWRNDFRFGNFHFGFLVSGRLGGVVYSATQAYLDSFGVSGASADARDAGGVWINGNDRISAQTWYQTVGSDSGVPQYYTYDATNVRLQEVSVGYTIPRRNLGGVVEMTLSLVGRNLWMIYNKAPFDPEMTATTGNYYQGIDYFMMPSLRSVGFNVRFNF